MSAYAHQMERGYSAQSQTLSSREVSELGSRYEAGFYMPSFAATIFIGALVIVGFLLITLIIALTLMLQSCESKSSGVVGLSKSIADYSNYKIFALQAELNSLEADDFPSGCKDLDIWYIREGQYARDLNSTLWMVECYFSSVTPLDDGLDVVLMDIDDIFPSNPHSTNLYRFDRCNDCAQEAKHLKAMSILRLYIKLRTRGWPMILLSRKPEKGRSVSIEYLISFGFGGWSSLIMRSDDEMQMDSSKYFLRRRAETGLSYHRPY